MVVTRVVVGDVDATSDVLLDQLAQEVIARDQQLEFAAFSRQLKSLLAFRELITDLFRAGLTAHYVNKERERLTWL